MLDRLVKRLIPMLIYFPAQLFLADLYYWPSQKTCPTLDDVCASCSLCPTIIATPRARLTHNCIVCSSKILQLHNSRHFTSRTDCSKHTLRYPPEFCRLWHELFYFLAFTVVMFFVREVTFSISRLGDMPLTAAVLDRCSIWCILIIICAFVIATRISYWLHIVRLVVYKLSRLYCKMSHHDREIVQSLVHVLCEQNESMPAKPILLVHLLCEQNESMLAKLWEHIICIMLTTPKTKL